MSSSRFSDKAMLKLFRGQMGHQFSPPCQPFPCCKTTRQAEDCMHTLDPYAFQVQFGVFLVGQPPILAARNPPVWLVKTPISGGFFVQSKMSRSQPRPRCFSVKFTSFRGGQGAGCFPNISAGLPPVSEAEVLIFPAYQTLKTSKSRWDRCVTHWGSLTNGDMLVIPQ